MPMADCGKCWLRWDASNGQFDMEENLDCPIHGWSDNAMEGEDLWLDATKSDSPAGEKPPPSPET